jgi:hypothetical protein
VWPDGGRTGVVAFRRERPGDDADRRVLGYLNGRMRSFVARQEMVFIAYAGDSFMRSGAAGFVGTAGRRHLVVPDLPVCGRASLLFVDFFDDVNALHVRGRCVVPGRFDVESAYFG